LLCRTRRAQRRECGRLADPLLQPPAVPNLMEAMMRKLALFFLLICSMNAAAQRLGDVVDIQGVRGNQLVGYSLVVGLDGTGDKNQVKFTSQSVTNMLRQFGVQLPAKIDPKVKNVAAVAISATLPP